MSSDPKNPIAYQRHLPEAGPRIIDDIEHVNTFDRMIRDARAKIKDLKRARALFIATAEKRAANNWSSDDIALARAKERR